MSSSPAGDERSPIEQLSAVTLATPDMAASVTFYRAVGFEVLYGGPEADFTSLRVGTGYLNLQRVDGASPGPWGRVILWVDDVDRMHARCREAGAHPETAPADAPWGERYFHVRDPAGHEISFARPLAPS